MGREHPRVPEGLTGGCGPNGRIDLPSQHAAGRPQATDRPAASKCALIGEAIHGSSSRVPCPTSPGADVAAASPVPVQMWQRQAESRCRCGSGEPSPRGRCGRGGPRSQSNAYRQAFCGVGLRRLRCRCSAAACAACPRAIAMACQRAARPIPAARSDARSGPNGMRRPLWATSVRASAGRFRDSGRHALWLAAIFRTSSECCVYKHVYIHIYNATIPASARRKRPKRQHHAMPCRFTN